MESAQMGPWFSLFLSGHAKCRRTLAVYCSWWWTWEISILINFYTFIILSSAAPVPIDNFDLHCELHLPDIIIKIRANEVYPSLHIPPAETHVCIHRSVCSSSLTATSLVADSQRCISSLSLASTRSFFYFRCLGPSTYTSNIKAPAPLVVPVWWKI